MRRIIDDFNRTQALVNSVILREQFKIINPFADSPLLETQRLCDSFSSDVLSSNPILEIYKNTFDYNVLPQAAHLSANFSNNLAYVHEVLSCTTKLRKQIEEFQKLTSFATDSLRQANQFQECLNRHFQNNYFTSLQSESARLRKVFESMIPQTTLNIPFVRNFPNDSFFFPSDVITCYETDDIKITERRTAKGKHFTITCTERLGVKEQEPAIYTLQESLAEIEEKLPCLFLTNLSREEISLLINAILGILTILTTSISAYVSHQDAERAHQDAERAHQDAIISQQYDKVQIEQGNKIIDLLEKNHAVDVKLLEEMRALREAQKLNIKNSNGNK